MNENIKNEIALFRYGLIAPLVTGAITHISKAKFFLECSQKKYILLGESVSLSARTIEQYYYDYMNLGYESLKPKTRSDKFITRKIDDEIKSVINHYIDKYPRLPATAIHEVLINNNYICKTDVSLSTISRYISKYKKDNKIILHREYRRYEAKSVNDIWCCDTSYSFYIYEKGTKRRTYVIAILDDASRYIIGYGVFFEDNYQNFLSVLKQAVKKYGVPKTLNCDNGGPYKNKQIEILCAKLGTKLYHSAPYSPEDKAKVERWFRTMKDHFSSTYHVTTNTTLNDVNDDLSEYILGYNTKKHSSLNDHTPTQRYFDFGESIRRITDEEIESFFLMEIERKVSKDNVISIENVEYEVDYKYCNKKITVRYSPEFKHVYVVDGTSLIEIFKLNKVQNSTAKRTKIQLNTEGI